MILYLRGLAGLPMVLAGELHRCFGRLRPAAQELNSGHAWRRNSEQQFGQFKRRSRRAVQRWREGEPLHLCRNRIDDRPIAVAETRNKHPGQPVDIPPAFAVGQVDAFALLEHHRVSSRIPAFA